MPSADLAARIAEELAALLPEKQSTVLDFVLSVKQQANLSAAEDGDAAWERIINDPRPRPRLEASMEQAIAEGSEPLDLDRM